PPPRTVGTVGEGDGEVVGVEGRGRAGVAVEAPAPAVADGATATSTGDVLECVFAGLTAGGVNGAPWGRVLPGAVVGELGVAESTVAARSSRVTGPTLPPTRTGKPSGGSIAAGVAVTSIGAGVEPAPASGALPGARASGVPMKTYGRPR